MTEAEKRQVVALWGNGVPIYQIVRMLPYSEKKAEGMLKELRDNGTLPPREVKAEMVEKVCNAYRNGEHNPLKLAEMFGKARNTINRYLVIGGIKKGKAPHHWKPKPKGDKAHAIIEELRKGEKTKYRIAKDYGVTRQYVNELKRGMNDGTDN